MASARLHTLSVVGDSPKRRRILDEGNRRTQASPVFQMWRRIEEGTDVEQRIKAMKQQRDGANDDIGTHTSETERNVGCGCFSEGYSEPKAGVHDGPHSCPAIGEAKRERIHQDSGDWGSRGRQGNSSNAPQPPGSSRAQCLGKNEYERGRVIREWVRRPAQDRGSCPYKDVGTKINAHIKAIRDRLVFNQNDCRQNRVHRKMHRLSAKAFLDFLRKAEKERQCELQDLAKKFAVSHFPHRNRIQSLLKSRFLRNTNLANEKQKTRYTAAGELELLKQRQTVSDLRGEFLSRTESLCQSQISCTNDHTPSSSGMNATGNKGGTTEKIHEKNILVLAKEDHSILNLQLVHTVNVEETMHASGESPTAVHEQGIHNDELDTEKSAGAYLTEPISGTVGEETLQEKTADEKSRRQLAGHLALTDLACDPLGSINRETDICKPSSSATESGGGLVEDMNWQGHVTEAEALHTQCNDYAGKERVAFDDCRKTVIDDKSNDHLTVTVDGLSLGASHGDYAELILSVGNKAWNASTSEGSAKECLHGPSKQVSDALPGSNSLHGSEKNVRTSELRGLVGRRRVSDLLGSGFRENLNRLLQTHLERQAHASMDWDPSDDMLSPFSEHGRQELQNENQNVHSMGTLGPVKRYGGPPSQRIHKPLSDVTLHQPLAIGDWEVICDMRTDITTLQHRMNDMQRMLEACMDMRLEFQRSVRQEVSAALNRLNLSLSQGLTSCGQAVDKSKWDHVQKGICCVCSHSNIDSLFYRCGHMCACTECANRLFEENNKCPMCQSPIVKVIRAICDQQQHK